jgi:hypothetical protein
MFAVVQKLTRDSYMTNERFNIIRENFGITEAGEKYCRLNSESVRYLNHMFELMVLVKVGP